MKNLFIFIKVACFKRDKKQDKYWNILKSKKLFIKLDVFK